MYDDLFDEAQDAQFDQFYTYFSQPLKFLIVMPMNQKVNQRKNGSPRFTFCTTLHLISVSRKL